MTSKSSRWVTNEEHAATEAQRRRDKGEKKRLREEKARKAEEAATAAAAKEQEHLNQENRERPSKRQRTSPPPSNNATEEGANLLQFPSRGFGPCESIEKYELLNNIEEGSYGKVSRARLKEDGHVVAIKKLKIENAQDGFPITGLREIHTLRSCSHTHIVHLHEVVMGSSLSELAHSFYLLMNSVYLVLSFIEHDLKSLLESLSEPFLPSEIKTLMLQLTSATSYLHSHYILHRDLKTSNILLNNRGEVKVADFGMARFTSSPPPANLTQLVVTLWYRAPELLLGTRAYSFEVDMWSLGCIFAELLTLEPLLQGKNEVDELSLIFALLGTPTNESWPDFRALPNAKALHPVLSKTNSTSSLTASKFPYLTTSGLRLLSSLLSLNPAKRPTADEVQEHKYFHEDPRPKPKEFFPTFPSKAGQEKRRRKVTPQAPNRGSAPKIEENDVVGIFAGRNEEEQGAGFALRMS